MDPPYSFKALIMTRTERLPGGWSDEPAAACDMLLVVLSPHLLRCRNALDALTRRPARPVLLSLQIAPLAEWVIAGVLTTPEQFPTERRMRLARCRADKRPALLLEWYAVAGIVLPVTPDLLDSSDMALEHLMSRDISCLYSQSTNVAIAPEYPAMVAGDPETKQALIADPGTAWGRSVWSSDLELLRELTACEHPVLRCPEIHGAPASYAACPAPARQEHTDLFDAFRRHSFFLDLTGPVGYSEMWDFAESVFAPVFGIESCFCVQVEDRSGVSVTLVSPAIGETARWSVAPADSSFVVIDAWENHAGAPAYLKSRQAFTAWAFKRF